MENSGQPAKLRGRRSVEMGFSGSALEAKGEKKQLRLVLEGRSQMLATALAPSLCKFPAS